MSNTVKQQKFIVTYTNPAYAGATISFIIDLEWAVRGTPDNTTLNDLLDSECSDWESQGFTPYVDPAIRKARREKAKANKTYGVKSSVAPKA